MLVVNDPGGERAACERLLGGHDLDRRHVFVPTTVSVAEVLDRHGTRSRDAGRFGVVDATDASTTRSAAAAASTGTAGPTIDGASDPEWYDEVADLTDLETLFATVHEHIERVVAGDRGAPGELRFCLDSIDPFFDAVPEETLFRFVHLLTSAIRDARGMGHFHTSAGAHDVTVATLEPLFDATVYVESQPDGTVEQRWVLTESGLSTDWFELD
ncbi:DUF7504 family protein [Halarchaeum sp. P4]|uniref:DUF7504 family protein n=1 Tax=Halarchaeum sp. P4 TaxID=3421639 RepID=UPI003EB8D521